jgi:hypothetical protein
VSPRHHGFFVALERRIEGPHLDAARVAPFDAVGRDRAPIVIAIRRLNQRYRRIGVGPEVLDDRTAKALEVARRGPRVVPHGGARAGVARVEIDQQVLGNCQRHDATFFERFQAEMTGFANASGEHAAHGKRPRAGR